MASPRDSIVSLRKTLKGYLKNKHDVGVERIVGEVFVLSGNPELINPRIPLQTRARVAEAELVQIINKPDVFDLVKNKPKSEWTRVPLKDTANTALNVLNNPTQYGLNEEQSAALLTGLYLLTKDPGLDPKLDFKERLANSKDLLVRLKTAPEVQVRVHKQAVPFKSLIDSFAEPIAASDPNRANLIKQQRADKLVSLASDLQYQIGGRIKGSIVNRAVSFLTNKLKLPGTQLLVAIKGATSGRGRDILALGVGAVGLLIGGPIGAFLAFGVASPQTLKRIGKLILGFFVLAIGAIFAAIAIPLVVSIFVVVFSTAAILFIINSGAYITPPNPYGIPGVAIDPGSFGEGISVGASCPIPGGQIICGTLGSQYTSRCPGNPGGHGSDSYWGTNSSEYNTIQRNVCTFALPSSSKDCYFNQLPQNACNENYRTLRDLDSQAEWTGRDCPYYGYSTDVSYPNPQTGLPVYLPYINNESVSWTVSWSGMYPAGGTGTLRTSDGQNTYEIYMTHLASPPVGGNSGAIAGLIGSFGHTTPHVHIELKINGAYVRPDFMCE